ncbi:PAS domain S-box protein [Calothrix sp. PCC 6303]|uniref:PAS domain S-box protein n=1 Tax=Calothrix sp. PCC 6303 TaxID=1170562 RepID=UPI0002A01376|nr:PAS domain S-box protein [Calothrix sp. PCC 6303]AFY99737.1 PAS/PAC sensor hybrid histidine kinase [Calothrix sp. PCC 6303]
MEDKTLMSEISHDWQQMLEQDASNQIRFCWHKVKDFTQALPLLVNESIDVVILDLGFPASQDLQVISSICVIAPTTAVIVISLDPGEAILEDILDAGGEECLIYNQITPSLLRRSLISTVKRKKRQISPSLDLGLMIHDGEVILSANQIVAHITGYELTDLIGKSRHQFFTYESQVLIRENISKKYENLLQLAVVRKDGTILGVEVQTQAILYQEKEVWFEIIKNVTSIPKSKIVPTTAVKKHDDSTEKALQQSESQFRAIFERSSIGIGLVDIKAKVVDVNPVLCKIIGYSREEVCGRRFTDFIDQHGDDFKAYRQLLAGTQDSFELERGFLRQDQRSVWIHVSVSLITGIDQEPQYFLAIVEDITERKETDLKLKETRDVAEAGSRAKSEFLATMSHELRTPLNAIMGLSQLLQQEMLGELNEKQREYVTCIYSSGEHLLALINDILDLSKVEAGKEELSLVKLHIPDLCNYVISTVRDRAAAKQLDLTFTIDFQLETFIADERRLKQMLLNLLSNAIKFTPSGSVSLKVQQVSQGVNFIVSDTGIGIDENNFKFLFEPFKQLDSQLNRQYEGTGLGLALTRKLARLHNGEITVESTLGLGSQFTLFIPHPRATDSESLQLLEAVNLLEHSNNPEVIVKGIQSKRILLVEDEINTAIRLQDYLQTIGYQVEQIANSSNFLEKIDHHKPHLILLDIHLADKLTGWDLLKLLRQQPGFQNIPVVMMIPPSESSDNCIFPPGANDYLKKPISIVQLESMLIKYLNY